MLAQGNEVHLIEEMEGEVREIETLTGLAAELYLYCDVCRDFDEICKAFPGIAKQALRFRLEGWVSRRWMCRSISDCYLALAVDLAPPASHFPVVADRFEETLSTVKTN